MAILPGPSLSSYALGFAHNRNLAVLHQIPMHNLGLTYISEEFCDVVKIVKVNQRLKLVASAFKQFHFESRRFYLRPKFIELFDITGKLG
jgi:hypothetical protein